MPVTTTAFQQAQYGTETSPGSGGTVNTSLVGLSLIVTPKADVSKFTPAGSLWPTLLPLTKDYAEVKIDGEPVYEELGFLFGSVLCTNAGGTYSPSKNSPNTASTYKVQVGNSTKCIEYAFGAITGLSFKWNRSNLSVGADMIGTAVNTATASWTASANPPATVTPMTPGDVTVTYGGSGYTNIFDIDLNVSGHWKPVWALNGNSSYAAMVETKPEGTIKVKAEADATGLAFLTHLRNNNITKLFVVTCVNGAKSCTITAATKVQDIQAFSDEDGVWCVNYTLAIVSDSAYSYAIKAVVV